MEAIIIFQDGLTSIQFFLHKADRGYRISMKATKNYFTMSTSVRQGNLDSHRYAVLDVPTDTDQPGRCIGDLRFIFVLTKTDHFTTVKNSFN